VATPEPADRRPELRAGDADRQRVADRLRRAHDEGRLDLEEFDERVTAAYAARTFGDLEALTTDLPPERAPRAPAPPARRPAPAPDRAAMAAWLGASVANIVIWGVVAVAAGEFVYPWWIWVVGPWGVLLLVQWIGSHRGGPGR
jgi:Domain of unknown function (DUF1707)